MGLNNTIRWYIKWWWAIGVLWFISFFFLLFVGFGIIGKFLAFLNVTISNEILKNIIVIIYFPGYIFTLIFKGIDTGFYGIIPTLFFYLITTYVLATIFKLLLTLKRGEDK